MPNAASQPTIYDRKLDCDFGANSETQSDTIKVSRRQHEQRAGVRTYDTGHQMLAP